jgi:hypothetical protein
MGVGRWELRMRVPEVSSGLSAPSRELGAEFAPIVTSVKSQLDRGVIHPRSMVLKDVEGSVAWFSSYSGNIDK